MGKARQDDDIENLKKENEKLRRQVNRLRKDNEKLRSEEKLEEEDFDNKTPNGCPDCSGANLKMIITPSDIKIAYCQDCRWSFREIKAGY